MTRFFQDLRYGFKTLLANKSFAAVAIGTLALGIGANTTMFSAFNAVVLRPLPYSEPERIVTVWDTFARVGAAKFGVAYANFADLKTRTTDVFEPLAVYQAQSNTSFILTGLSSAERLQGARVTGDFFRALGVSPFLGRTLTTDDEAPGRNRVVVVSHGFWQRALGSDPKALDRSLELNNTAFRIVGVMPPRFTFPSGKDMPVGQQFTDPTDVWTPLTIPATSAAAQDRIHHSYRMVARLKSGVAVQRAQERASAVMQQLTVEHPNDNDGIGTFVLTLRENQVAAMRPALTVLLIAVGAVLLIACTNVANLLLSRSTMRQREFAIRASLGATRSRILRQLLTESLLLSVLGGIAGLALSALALRSIGTIVPATLPRVSEASLDWRVLGFTALLTILTGVLFGLAPALQAAKRDLFDAVKGDGRTTAGSRSQRRLRNVLVASQIVLVFVLLTGAGLMLRSFKRLEAEPAGFDPNRVLTGRVTLPGAPYPPDRKLQFYRDLLGRLSEQPGVRTAAVIRDLPMEGTDPRYGVFVDGRPQAEHPDGYSVRMRVASNDYFSAMSIAVRQGRAFDRRDLRGGAPVAILNEAAAKRMFPGESAVGRSLTTFGGFAAEHVEVIGVTGDVKFSGLDAAVDGEIYVPFEQLPESFVQPGIGSMAVVLKSASAAVDLTTQLRAAVAAVDPNVPVTAVMPLDSLLGASLAPRRFNLTLLAFFGSASLLLAAVGIYGVLSYWVAQRTREIGTRMALGAQRRDVFQLVISEAMTVVVLGLAAGAVAALTLAYTLTRALPGLLFGVSATDPFTIVAAAVLLSLAALAACIVPARRALSVAPNRALRMD